MTRQFFTTTRLTGLFYLALAITGIFAFLFARAELYISGDAAATTTNFIKQEGLARFGIAAELALVAFQALAAVWFFKLFQKANMFAAFSLAAFGIVNTVLILIADSFWLKSVLMALNGSEANLVMNMFEMHEAIWLMGKLFFGFWLIPMGYLAIITKMPKALGWILIVGGVGYVASSFLSILTPNLTNIIEMTTIPATIGEFWMIGYLLIKKNI